MSKGLPQRSNDFSAWYNELVKKADLAENSAVRGCMVIKPYGFSIWEKMQSTLDQMFKERRLVRMPAVCLVASLSVFLALSLHP